MEQKQNKPLLPAYLVVGDDALKRGQVVERLEKRMASEGDLSFNYDRFTGTDATAESIIASCNVYPFMSDKRLVVVDNGEMLPASQLGQLAEYVENPNDMTVLCFVCEKLAKNTKLYKAFAAYKNAIVACDLPKEKDIASLVRNMAIGFGITFSPSAAQLLAEYVGADTVALHSEIEKIALYHTGKDPVSAQEVQNLVNDASTVKPWVMLDAFSRRDAKLTCDYLSKLSHESPYYLLSLVQARLRDLIAARSLQGEGGVPALAKALGKSDWQVKNYPAWSKNYSMHELTQALCLSVEVEARMKSGSNPADELLIFMTGVMAKLG